MSTSINEYSFSHLFGAEYISNDGQHRTICDIEIPIIQRDYAQGRQTDTVRRIRDRFLSSIHNAITTHSRLSLDFVYGDIDANGKFIPLDGQQRLTTLFLLHWYASRKEAVADGGCEFLNHFTYYTRPASRDFCTALAAYRPEDIEIMRDNADGKTISEDIRNQTWFQYQWTNDPTINSMLVMIDAIREHFADTDNLWHALTEEELVTFYFLCVSDMEMTDEIYIKMNSRGKPLTQFEHFKAEFEGMIEKVDAKTAQRFNSNFDKKWADMLFPYRGENNIIDDEFMRYFFFVSDIICYKQDGVTSEKDEFRLAEKLYGEGCPNAQQNLEFLELAFDCWCGIDIQAFFEKHFAGKQYSSGHTQIYQDEVNIFKQCLDTYGEYEGRNRKFSLPMTLLLNAVLQYMMHREDIKEDDFQRRIRIVRNLIWNSEDEIRASGEGANMPDLLRETDRIIITGTIPEDSEGRGYNKRQKEEERQKLEWVKMNPTYADELYHLEDHNLLRGCIAVVGLERPDHFDRFRNLFDNCDKRLISRALLSYGDYSQYFRWKWQLGTKNDTTWRALFHPTKQRDGFEDRTKPTLSALLAAHCEFTDDILQEDIDRYLNKQTTPMDWRYYFVKYPAMSDSQHGWFYTYDDGDYHTLKMNVTQLNGKTWNIFLLQLRKSYDNRIKLGDYAYQDDTLQIANDVWMDCENDRYILYYGDNEESQLKIPPVIPRDENRIDTEDRIVFGKRIIDAFLNAPEGQAPKDTINEIKTQHYHERLR